MPGEAYSQSCCDGSGTLPTGDVESYYQCRLISTGDLADVWIPASSLPTIPPTYTFYNPTDGNCYEVLSTDTPVTPLPSGSNLLAGWQDTTANPDTYTALCTPSFLQARDCNDNLLALYKASAGLTLPYAFKTSGGVCGLIDASSPQTHSPGPLLTGETTVSGCTDSSCLTATFEYDTGRLSELHYAGGTADSYTSSILTINVTGATNITFNSGVIDDIAILMGASESVTTVRDSNHNMTVTVPADAWIIRMNSGSTSMSGITGTPATGSVINVGTNQIRIGAANPAYSSLDATTIGNIEAASGVNLITLGVPIPLSSLSAFITGSLLQFKLCLVPYGTGQITIPSITLT